MSYPALSYAPAARTVARPTAPRPAVAAFGASAPRAGYAGVARSQAARYRDAELASATPGQLVVMLFDKMLLTLRRARVAIDAADIEQRTTQLIAATEMVTELRVSLDHEAGGDISRNLDALYVFMLQELHAASRQLDGKRVDVVLRLATELREAFAGAQQQLAGAPTAARSA
jgi:flagellar protein FliS